MSKIKDAVERGSKLLDEKVPNWWERIEMSKLDMTSSCDCICGQLFEHMAWGCSNLGVYSLGLSGSDFGFNLVYIGDPEFNPSTWEDLKDLWIVEINKRLLSTST